MENAGKLAAIIPKLATESHQAKDKAVILVRSYTCLNYPRVGVEGNRFEALRPTLELVAGQKRYSM